MYTFNLHDTNFSGQASSCLGKAARLVTWDRTCESSAPTFYTDRCILNGARHPGKYGWILEPPAIVPEVYARIHEFEDIYDQIFTSSTALTERRPEKYTWAPASGIWIRKPTLDVIKTRTLSMITSPKASTVGHKLRLEWMRKLNGMADVFGFAARVPLKEPALVPYRFSVVIENDFQPGYFTEKLLDCLATVTVPLYRGAPDIGCFFDERGFLPLDIDPRELTPRLYESCRRYATDNFHEALRYEIPEDFIAGYFTGAADAALWQQIKERR